MLQKGNYNRLKDQYLTGNDPSSLATSCIHSSKPSFHSANSSAVSVGLGVAPSFGTGRF